MQPDKKGDFYVAVIEKPGRAAIDVIGEILPDVIETFPWPKSMRWGVRSKRAGRAQLGAAAAFDCCDFRPGDRRAGHRAVFGRWHRRAGNETRGHRFLAPAPFTVRRLDDYLQKLDKAKVVPDAERRRDIIFTEAKQLAFAQGLELVEDDGLLAEVAGLVEWPVVLMGSFDEDFLHIPGEVIRATIRNNQKCFVLRDAAHAKLVNKFILVANIEAEDGGKAIVAGNERVIRARLSDAKFFYETDLKTRLEDRLPKFKQIVFHEKLGTQAERIERIERACRRACAAGRRRRGEGETRGAAVQGGFVDRSGRRVSRAARPDGEILRRGAGRGRSGRARLRGSLPTEGPGRSGAERAGSIAVALADKIDTLVGFWAIDEKPTGSKDPYALRRAALGVSESVVDNEIRLPGFDRAHTGANVRACGAKCQATVLDQRADNLHLRIRAVRAPESLWIFLPTV